MTDAFLHALLIRDKEVRSLSPADLAAWRPADGLLWVHLHAEDPGTAP